MPLPAKKTVATKKIAPIAPKPSAAKPAAPPAPKPFSVPTPTPKPELDYALLQQVVDGSFTHGSVLLTQSQVDAFLALRTDIIEVHPDVQENGMRAVRPTQVGIDLVYPPMQGEIGQPLEGDGNGEALPETETGETTMATNPFQTANPAPVPAFTNGTPAPNVKKERPTVQGFTIQSGIPLPERKKASGPRRGETYPFSTMNPGDSFFIPATPERPKPATSYNSTVTSAAMRYAVPTGRKTINRRGKEVDEMKLTRRFVIRPWVEQDGTQGARVWRVDGLPGYEVESPLK